MEKLEYLCIAGGNVEWCSHCGKVWQFLIKLNVGLPYNLTIPLLNMHTKELKTGTQS